MENSATPAFNTYRDPGVYSAYCEARYTTGRTVGQLAFRTTHETWREAQEAAEETLRLTGHRYTLLVTDVYGSEDGYSHGYYACPCTEGAYGEPTYDAAAEHTNR